MPAHRNARRTAPAGVPGAQDHSSRLVRLRARLRKLLDNKLRDITRNRRARMRWSAEGYARYVVIRGGKVLVGWPTHAGVPFGNLSDVPGGQPVMGLLLALWTSGVLRFEDATEEDIDLAISNPEAVLPGLPIDHGRGSDAQLVTGSEDAEDPIEDAVWSSEVEGDSGVEGIEEFTE